jgi:hypothetical protein
VCGAASHQATVGRERRETERERERERSQTFLTKFELVSEGALVVAIKLRRVVVHSRLNILLFGECTSDGESGRLELSAVQREGDLTESHSQTGDGDGGRADECLANMKLEDQMSGVRGIDIEMKDLREKASE